MRLRDYETCKTQQTCKRTAASRQSQPAPSPLYVWSLSPLPFDFLSFFLFFFFSFSLSFLGISLRTGLLLLYILLGSLSSSVVPVLISSPNCPLLPIPNNIQYLAGQKKKNNNNNGNVIMSVSAFKTAIKCTGDGDVQSQPKWLACLIALQASSL